MKFHTIKVVTGYLSAVVYASTLIGCQATVSDSSLERVPGIRVDTLRILAYNIHHGEGMDERIDLDRIADLINDLDPDLVAMQEVDSVVDRTQRVDQATVLAGKTGMDAHFGEFMPYQGGKYGMSVLSRWPVLEFENIRLPDGDEPRSSATVTVQSPATGAQLIFAGIHFYRTEQERGAQAQSLVERLSDSTLPTILAGDFNSQPGTFVMQFLDKNYSILEKEGNGFTFPSYEPAREIDFILIRDGTEYEVLSHQVLNEPVMSDHQPILADIVLRTVSN